MSTKYRKNPNNNKRNDRCSKENKNNFRNQDMSNFERRKAVGDYTFYFIARYLMGNEVQVFTKTEKIEGVLHSFDSFGINMTKVIVYDSVSSNSIKTVLEMKEINFNDVNILKKICAPGKLCSENVLIDQDISYKKQITKTGTTGDDPKNLVPYFNDDDHKAIDDEDLANNFGNSNDSTWGPEDMLKLNEEKFQLKNTFSEEMEEYTTPIDRSDPNLREKYDIADRLAKEIESDTLYKKNLNLEDDDSKDEETRFSAVVSTLSSHTTELMVDTDESVAVSGTTLSGTTPSSTNPTVPSSVIASTSTSSTTAKLNPNAKEFHPRTSQYTTQPISHIVCAPQSSVSLSNSSSSQQISYGMRQNLDDVHQHQQSIMVSVNDTNPPNYGNPNLYNLALHQQQLQSSYYSPHAQVQAQQMQPQQHMRHPAMMLSLNSDPLILNRLSFQQYTQHQQQPPQHYNMAAPQPQGVPQHLRSVPQHSSATAGQAPPQQYITHHNVPPQPQPQHPYHLMQIQPSHDLSQSHHHPVHPELSSLQPHSTHPHTINQPPTQLAPNQLHPQSQIFAVQSSQTQQNVAHLLQQQQQQQQQLNYIAQFANPQFLQNYHHQQQHQINYSITRPSITCPPPPTIIGGQNNNNSAVNSVPSLPQPTGNIPPQQQQPTHHILSNGNGSSVANVSQHSGYINSSATVAGNMSNGAPTPSSIRQ